MDEAIKVSDFIKGVGDGAFQLVVVMNPTTVSVFCDACNKFEEGQDNRFKQMT